MKTSLPVAVAALMLAGCGSGSSHTPSSSTQAPVTTTATASPPPSVTPADSRADQIKAIYLDNIRDEQPALMDVPGDDLVTMGRGFCSMYDGGAVGADINEYILEEGDVGFTVEELVAVHGAAVGAFCPRHIDKMGS
jgi:hypothetical protein